MIDGKIVTIGGLRKATKGIKGTDDIRIRKSNGNGSGMVYSGATLTYDRNWKCWMLEIGEGF